MATNQPTVAEKHCTGCSQTKAASEFHRQAAHRTGLHFYCKPCTRERTNASRAARGEEFLKIRRAYYRANREKLKERARDKYMRRPQSARLASWRKSGVSLSWEEYERLLSSQSGLCAICQKDEGGNGKALAVDHDHDSGAVRGLLCDDCNIALGRFQDSPEVLRRALNYLRTV